MANPLLGARTYLKPGFQWFQPGACAPQWRWFWQLAVFAEPIWGSLSAGAFDYTLGVKANSMDSANVSWTIGQRGRRRRWGGANDYLYWNNGASGSTSAPTQYYQPGDCSIFCVVEPSTPTNGTHILAWEGDSADDGTANSNTCFNLSWSATSSVTHFHESGTGTNHNVVSSNNIYSGNERFALCATRTTATKTVEFWKNGTTFSSNTYTTDCALGNKLYIDIGDRNNVLAGDNVAIECMYIFKSVLSASMIQALTVDPWGAFRTPAGHSPAATGGTGGTGLRSFCAGMIG